MVPKPHTINYYKLKITVENGYDIDHAKKLNDNENTIMEAALECLLSVYVKNWPVQSAAFPTEQFCLF